MSTNKKDSKAKDTRPVYTPPQVVHLDDMHTGTAACAAGSAAQLDCGIPGNGASGSCAPQGLNN